MEKQIISDLEVKEYWHNVLKNFKRPTEISYEEGDTLIKIWKRRVSLSKRYNCIEFLDKSYTFYEVDKMSDSVAAYLLESKHLKVGDSIAVQMPNIGQYIIAVLGILKAGMTVVNCNPLYTETELEYQLKDSNSKAIFILSNVALAASNIIEKTNIKVVIETDLFDIHGVASKYIKNFVVKHVKKMVPKHDFPNSLNYTRFNDVLSSGKLLLQNKPLELSDVFITKNIKVKHDTPAFYQYTGGTTGVSKGAILTHKNMTYNAVSAHHSGLLTLFNKDKDTTKYKDTISHGYICLPLPLYHIYSLHTFFLFTVMTGLCGVLIPNPRDFDSFIKTLKNHDYNVMPAIQTLLIALMKHKDFNKVNWKDCFVLNAGMGLSPEIYQKWEDATQTKVVEGYGLTECSPTVLCNPWYAPEKGKVGIPICGTYCKLQDDNGNDIPLGSGDNFAGEILVKGPQVMAGYLNKKEETDNIFTKDGWLKTGDYATVSESGQIAIVGRKKELIIVSGFNVYPDEVENAVLGSGLVSECAAIGVPDSVNGEKIIVYVVPNGSFKEEDLKKKLQEHSAKSLTNYKRPKDFRFVKELPKSPVGKVLRRLVKEQELARKN